MVNKLTKVDNKETRAHFTSEIAFPYYYITLQNRTMKHKHYTCNIYTNSVRVS